MTRQSERWLKVLAVLIMIAFAYISVQVGRIYSDSMEEELCDAKP